VGDNSSEDRSDITTSTHGRGADIDPVLRAKYLDYCSARISEVFLSLSDERTYQLMEEAARESGLAVGSLGFPEMMRLVTRKLQRGVPLPDLEKWAREYEEDPARYDAYLLGLWEEETEEERFDSEGGSE
jgi:hypothetical protein